MVAGVPVQYGSQYLGDAIVQGELEGQPTGRLCFDYVVPGLNKRLVLDWMLREGTLQLTDGVAVAFGDSPAGNDSGLAFYHETGIPFVSVCEHARKVPPRLLDCHVGANELGAGAAISLLVQVQQLADEKFGAGEPRPVLDLASMRGLAFAARLDLEKDGHREILPPPSPTKEAKPDSSKKGKK